MSRLDILHITPYPPLKNGIADYAVAFERGLNRYRGIRIVPFFDELSGTGRSHLPSILREYARLIRILKRRRFDLIHFEVGGSLLKEFILLFMLTQRKRLPPVVMTVHDPPRLVDTVFFSRFVFLVPSRFLGGYPVRKGLSAAFKRIRRKKGGDGRAGSRILRGTGTDESNASGFFEDLRPAVPAAGSAGNLVYKANDAVIARLERIIWRKAALAFVFTRSGARSLAERFGDYRTQVIPHGVLGLGDRAAEGERGTEKFTVLFFGFITRGKGIETLIEAMRFVLEDEEKRGKIQALICGDTAFNRDRKYVASLARYVTGEGLDDAICFRLRVPEQELGSLFRQADLMVLPYEPLARYSTSGSLIRGMAAGLPVVVSNARGLGDEVVDGESGLVFESGNPEDLSEKILRVYEDKALRHRLGREARSHIMEEHSWDKISSVVAVCYRRVLSERGSRSR